MTYSYDPRQYWELRLSQSFNLRGVGNMGFSERYNQWLYRRKSDCIQRFFAGASLEGKQVIDVGCGTGFFVDWYLRQGAQVSGSDITEVSVQQLSARYPCEFRVSDISDPSYTPPQKFDIVNMWDVIYHIVIPAHFEHAIANLASSLKPGGLLLLTDAFGASRDQFVADHVTMRCLDTYQQLMPRYGFHLLALHPLYNLLNRRILNRPADNRLGWLYYQIDSHQRLISPNNLSLAIWERQR